MIDRNLLPVPAFRIFRVKMFRFAACAAIGICDIQPAGTVLPQYPFYLMEYRHKAGNVFFRRGFPPDLLFLAIVAQGIIRRGSNYTMQAVVRQGL